jgi:hypothetical protein
MMQVKNGASVIRREESHAGQPTIGIVTGRIGDVHMVEWHRAGFRPFVAMELADDLIVVRRDRV